MIIPLIVALSLNFAALEFVVLIVIGFFLAKLHCYRFANSIMKLMSFGQ